MGALLHALSCDCILVNCLHKCSKSAWDGATATTKAFLIFKQKDQTKWFEKHYLSRHLWSLSQPALHESLFMLTKTQIWPLKL